MSVNNIKQLNNTLPSAEVLVLFSRFYHLHISYINSATLSMASYAFFTGDI